MTRLYGLDALRGIAAIMVLLHHVRATYLLQGPDLLAHSAVDIFFMLSGFVMTRTYEGRLKSGLSTPRFVGLRYKRLWKPLAVGSAIGFAWIGLAQGFDAPLLLSLAAILAFLPALWMPGELFLLNIPAWSLFVEILANALHGVLFRRLGNRGLLACLALAAAVFLWTTLATDRSVYSFRDTNLFPTLCRGITCYLIGVMIHRWFGDRPLPVRPDAALIAFPLILVLFGNFLPPGPASILFAFVAAPLLLRASLGLAASPAAMWLGALSYPLYAIHQPVLDVSRGFGASPVLALLLAMAAGVVVMWVFEIPLRKRSGGKGVLQSPLDAKR